MTLSFVKQNDTRTAQATTVDEAVLARHHIIAHRTQSEEADRFRILRTKVLSAMDAGKMQTLGITSANYGDGKTTIALNLALSIAMDVKHNVLLVDLDLRKPCVAEYLGIKPAVGLRDYFMEDVSLASCLIRTSFPRLSILPAGKPLFYSSEMLGSPKIAALASEMHARYPDRLIIYDLPPLLAQDDPLVFMPHMDTSLLVVKEGDTRVEDVRSCLRTLAHSHVLGTVLNHSFDRRPARPRPSLVS